MQIMHEIIEINSIRVNAGNADWLSNWAAAQVVNTPTGGLMQIKLTSTLQSALASIYRLF